MFSLRESDFAALHFQLQGHEVQPDSFEQKEFVPIGQGQPWNILKFLITNAQKLEPEQVQEIEEVAEQISLPKQICEMAGKKLTESGRRPGYVKHFKEFIYDPSAAAHGTLQYVQMGRFLKFNEKCKKVNEQFFQTLVTSALLAVLVTGLWEFISSISEQLGFPLPIPHIFGHVEQYITAVSGIVIAGLLWKVVQILQEFLDMSKFGMSEISRIRLSVATGNVAQLLKRILGKVEYIEQRSSSIFGHTQYFWKQVDTEVGQVKWTNHEKGYEHLEAIILDFIAQKFMNGYDFEMVGNTMISKLKEDLIAHFAKLSEAFAAKFRGGQIAQDAKAVQHLRFLCMIRNVKIVHIWEKYGHFREPQEIIWKA